MDDSNDLYKLRTKNAMRRMKGWSEDFFDSLQLPRYPIGKRDYYRLCDIEPTLERIKQDKSKKWASTKTRNPRTGNMTSPSQVLDIEAARKLITSNRHKTSSLNSGLTL